MKKLALLLASLFLLGGCSSEFIKEFSYTPKGGLDYDVTKDPGGGSGGSGGGSSDQGGEGGQQGGGEQSGDEGEDEEKLMCTYNIYFSYNHTTKYVPSDSDPSKADPSKAKDVDCPIVTFEAPMLEPYGKVPDEIAENGVLSETKFKQRASELYGFTPDPVFPKFLGLSFHGLCLDSSDLWDFTKDYKQLAVVTLYGVWYSDQAL